MVQYVIGLLIILAVAYNFSLIGQAVSNGINPFLPKHFKSTSDLPRVRSQYGQYGRNLAEDNEQYQLIQKTKSPVETTAVSSSLQEQDQSAFSAVNQDSASMMVGSPLGVHGNNHSLYDINSPSGQLGKFK